MGGKANSRSCGFTLVEVLVSSVLLVLLLTILLGVVNQTSSAWRYSTSKVEQFRGARSAFESITRRLSQATLNTYWDYQYTGSGASLVPSKYIRQSDLRFWSGDMQAVEKNANRPGHGVFFQAPMGMVEATSYSGLPNLLNTWGYFVEFKSEEGIRPPFLESPTSPIAGRYRFRLMEAIQPSERLDVYQKTMGTPNYAGKEWIKSLTNRKENVRVLSENVIALVLLPKLSEKEDPTGFKLSPSYTYDSSVSRPDPAIDSKNQLPPTVQVTLVALDELSALRVANEANQPVLVPGMDKLFLSTAAKYSEDLTTLETGLAQKRLSYRVFTTQVSIRGAKWSRN